VEAAGRAAGAAARKPRAFGRARPRTRGGGAGGAAEREEEEEGGAERGRAAGADRRHRGW